MFSSQRIVIIGSAALLVSLFYPASATSQRTPSLARNVPLRVRGAITAIGHSTVTIRQAGGRVS